MILIGYLIFEIVVIKGDARGKNETKKPLEPEDGDAQQITTRSLQVI